MDISRFDRLQDAANNDPEFRIAARFWNSALRFEMGEAVLHVRLVDGRISEVAPGRPAIELLTPSNICVAASAAEWQQLLQPIPKPFYVDLWSATAHHGFTVQVAVYLLTGEYDWGSTPEMSAELARRIKGAKYQTMTGLGHFPMSEDPERCVKFVEPILNEIRERARK